MKLARLDFAVAGVLAAGYFVALGVTSSGVGYVRDEGHYFHAGAAYARWFEALWDDVAEVKTKAGERVLGARISGDAGSGMTVRVPGGKRFVAAADIAELKLAPHPDRSRVFTRAFIDSIWRENFEHPVLMKTLFVLSHRVFYERLGWLNQGDAYRMPAWVFAALLVFLTYLFGVELYDRRAGLFAAAAIVTQPHVFFHAHLACFDVPVVTTWLAMLYAFWKAQTSTYWAITCGPLLAVAFATKHNAFFLPFLFIAYVVASRWRELRFPRLDGVRRLSLPPIPIAILSMLVLTPLLYFAHWPYLWNDPIQKFGGYLGFHLHHEHYDTPYLGAILKLPPFPWHFPFVMTALTVPETTLLPMVVGFLIASVRILPWVPIAEARAWWSRRRAKKAKAEETSSAEVGAAEVSGAPPKSEPSVSDLERLFPSRPARLFPTDQIELLLWLGAFVPFAIIAMPNTPKFGGVKHWMNGAPLLALFGGAAMNLVLRVLAQRWPKLRARPNALFAVVAGLVLAPSLVALVRTGPYGTSYHNLFAGGLSGAARVGNTIQFWGPTFRNVEDWLNANAEQGAGICHHEMNSRGFVAEQRDGYARKDFVGLTGLGRECDYQRADYMVYQHMQEYQNNEVDTWAEFGTTFPVHTVALDGMLVVSVYKKPIRAVPENAVAGDLLYGRANVGRFTRANDGAVELSAWGKRGDGRGTCVGTFRAGQLERAGQPPRAARDLDDAYRSLIEGCFGRRLPR